jgi:hypothetical protein
MSFTIRRPVHGLFVFLGRIELQSRAYFRSHHQGSGTADHGPEAIRRELEQLRAHPGHHETHDDFNPPAQISSQPPVAMPARMQHACDATAPTRKWFRIASDAVRGRF